MQVERNELFDSEKVEPELAPVLVRKRADRALHHNGTDAGSCVLRTGTSRAKTLNSGAAPTEDLLSAMDCRNSARAAGMFSAENTSAFSNEKLLPFNC